MAEKPKPTRKNISISKLHFDSENPRLPSDMDRSNDEAVLHWMIRKGDIIDLMAAIGATDFSSAEAVLVIEKDGSPGEYEVVEGNRRLAAVKLLSDPGRAQIRKKTVHEIVDNAKFKPYEIPVLIYPDRTEILTYLGYRHITGVKAWGAAEKAKYLKQLFAYYLNQGMEAEKVFHTISKATASTPYYAKKTLTTLALADLANDEAYWQLDRLKQADVKFSVLGTALNHSQIVDFLGLESVKDYKLEDLKKERLKELFKWLFQRSPDGETVVKESRQLKSLAKVVSNNHALELLRKGYSLENASEFTDEADEVFQRLLLESLKKIELAQSQVKRINKPSESDLETIREIYRLSKDLGLTVRSRIEDDEADEPF